MKVSSFFRMVLPVAIAIFATAEGNAQGLGDILGGGSLKDVIEGVFAKSNLSVADIAGEWTSNAPAVSFKSDNLLKKAGGVAAATAVENKLAPYYDRLGLNGAVITIEKDSTFTMQIKRMKLTGTVSASTDEKGSFQFAFSALGKINLGKVTVYVQKTGSSMDLMFDATKLKSIMSAVASFSGISLAKTASSILDSYDGMCIGFKCTKTGNVAGASGTTASADTTSGSSASQGLGVLIDRLKKK